jgi:GTP-binding protein
VDLPGYGFAKLSGERHDEMIRMSEEYLEERENLQGVFQICDINVITKDDILMSKYFNDTFNNYFIILNKIDSIKPSELEKMVTLAANKLNVTKDKLILVSAKSSTNVSQVYMTMTKLARERN